MKSETPNYSGDHIDPIIRPSNRPRFQEVVNDNIIYILGSRKRLLLLFLAEKADKTDKPQKINEIARKMRTDHHYINKAVDALNNDIEDLSLHIQRYMLREKDRRNILRDLQAIRLEWVIEEVKEEQEDETVETSVQFSTRKHAPTVDDMPDFDSPVIKNNSPEDQISFEIHPDYLNQHPELEGQVFELIFVGHPDYSQAFKDCLPADHQVIIRVKKRFIAIDKNAIKLRD